MDFQVGIEKLKERRKEYEDVSKANEEEISRMIDFLNEVGRTEIKFFNKDDSIATLLSDKVIKEVLELNRHGRLTELTEEQRNRVLEWRQKLIDSDLLLDFEIINGSGQVDVNKIKDIIKIKGDVEKKRLYSGNSIGVRLHYLLEDAPNSDKVIKQFLPDLDPIPTDFLNMKLKDMKRLLKSLTNVEKRIYNRERLRNMIRERIISITKLIERIEKGILGKDTETLEDSRTVVDYRNSGVKLDGVYYVKNWRERYETRVEYLMGTIDPNTPFRQLRARVRGVFPKYGYALSELKNRDRRSAEAFRDTLSILEKEEFTPEQARRTAKEYDEDSIMPDIEDTSEYR